jgi:peptidoglycan-N-acetylglucosamine deacetylase
MRIIKTLLFAIAIVVLFQSMPASAQCVALTFDDGPHPSLTPKLLEILAREKVKATFYMLGHMVQQSPTIAKAVSNAGHEIGNHSYSHPNLTHLSAREVRVQIERTDEVILAATGMKPKTLRAPYGAVTPKIEAMFNRPFVGWGEHGDTLDWKHVNATLVARAGAAIPPGEIMLMHDIHATTVAAVPSIIQKLKARGFSFVTVSEFLSGSCKRMAHAG